MMNNGINCVKRSTPAGSDICNLRNRVRMNIPSPSPAVLRTGPGEPRGVDGNIHTNWLDICGVSCAGRHSDSRLAPAHAVYAVARGRGAWRARAGRALWRSGRAAVGAPGTRTDGANRPEAVDPAGRGTGEITPISLERARGTGVRYFGFFAR